MKYIDVEKLKAEKGGITMKYIDAYLLREEIKKQKSLFSIEKEKEGLSKADKLSLGARIASLEETIVLIDSLQQEQPVEGLEEAAEEYLKEYYAKIFRLTYDDLTSKPGSGIIEAFKAGAKWMAKQIKTKGMK